MVVAFRVAITLDPNNSLVSPPDIETCVPQSSMFRIEKLAVNPMHPPRLASGHLAVQRAPIVCGLHYVLASASAHLGGNLVYGIGVSPASKDSHLKP